MEGWNLRRKARIGRRTVNSRTHMDEAGTQDRPRSAARATTDAPALSSLSRASDAWPAVQNFHTWDSGTDLSWEHYGMWIDPTKAPLGNG